MDKKVFFNTTVSENLIKEFKVLAVQQGKRQNQLLEEAIQDLLKKYQKPHLSPQSSSSHHTNTAILPSILHDLIYPM